MNKKYNLHIIALLIFSTYYLLSLLIFNTVAISTHDNLDITQVYNHVISKIINGELESYKIFIAGEFKWYYLDKIFYPFNIFHLIIDNKHFYFFEEILKKIISYFSFYLFSKSFFNNKKNAIIGALFYTALINNINSPAPTIFLPFLPYLLYLVNFKDHFKLKHIAAIFLIGLNSSLVFDYLSMILMIIFSFFIMTKKKYEILFNFLIVISLSMIISSIPLFLSVLDEPMHRTVMGEKNGIFNIIILELRNLYELFFPHSLKGIFYLPTFLLKILIIISCFFINDKKIKFFLFFIFLTYLLKNLFSSDLTQIIFSQFFTFLKGFNFSRVGNILPLLFSILLVAIITFNKNQIFKNVLITLTIISSIFLQLYFPVKEFSSQLLKKNLKKESIELIREHYQNKKIKEIITIINDKKNYKHKNFIYNVKTDKSFDTYYRFKTYKKIKLLVGSSRVASIGLDPMIAAMNDINVIDGYHNIYPLSYKKKFRKIIQEELSQNNSLKDYYDDWGNRVYMFYSNKNNLLFNFNEAKNLGAEYIISSFLIENINLKFNYLLYDEDKKIYLYEII
jgi:hypothetical protein